MKWNVLFLFLGLVSSSARALEAPAQLEKNSYLEWSKSVGAVDSPYANYLFNWFDLERNRELPAEASRDPNGIYVNVDSTMRECIALEEAGDVEEGISYGSELYTKVNAPIHTVMETILYRWGKPVGKESGTTFPVDTVYSFRQETLEKKYGEGGYSSVERKRNGGFAKDVNDEYLLLVRGDDKQGYEMIGQFVRPVDRTSTKSVLMAMVVRPLSDGATSFKGLLWMTGQSYSFLGNVSMGRRNFGFNADRVYQGQKDFLRMVEELKSTGNIRDRR